MKEECTSFRTKGLNIDEKLISLPLTYSAWKTVHRLKYLCTRTDSDVQGVESGSSILIVMNSCLSEFIPYIYYGVDSSFMFSLLSGFARTLLSENVESGFTPLLFNTEYTENLPNKRGTTL